MSQRKPRKPTPLQLLRAAEIVERWAATREGAGQEADMAIYTADNMKITALAEQRNNMSNRAYSEAGQ